MLCKSPVAAHSPMAASLVGKSSRNMFHGHSLLGFSQLVAPLSQAAKTWYQGSVGKTVSGDVFRLLGSGDASPQMAPSLLSVIRGSLQRKQVSPEAIDQYLTDQPSLERYNRSFRLLWSMAAKSRLDLSLAPLEQVASLLITLHHVSPSQARNAYAGLLLIPELGQLRFCTLLQPYKRVWGASTPKYAAFWSAQTVFQRLVAQPLNWHSIAEVRDRLILVWRLLHLSRSVDLARLYRCVSQVGDDLFVLSRRKGWATPQWELVLELPKTPEVSPRHLLLHYVALTASLAPKNGTVLLTLSKPYGPLSSNTVGSITKRLLHTFGISTAHWGPHSTRGAGVTFYRQLGLPADEVCEIGKWKSTEAFSKHYSRLGATKSARVSLERFVHNVSPGDCAEPDQSRTPVTMEEPGGSDWEGVAHEPGEPTLPPLTSVRRPSQTPSFAPRRHLPGA